MRDWQTSSKHITLVILASMLCITAQAQIKFQKTYVGHLYEIPRALQETKDKGYIVLGDAYVPIPDSQLLHVDQHLIRIDADGSVRWSTRYGKIGDEEDFDDYSHSVAEIPDGGFLVGGQTQSDRSGYMYASLVRISAGGDPVWAQELQIPDAVISYIVPVKDTTYDFNFVAAGNSPMGVFMMGLDEEGNQKWTRTIPLQADMDRVIVREYHHWVTDGYMRKKDKGFALAGSINKEFFLLKFDSLLKVDRFTVYEHQGDDYIGGMITTADQGFLLTGTNFPLGLSESSQAQAMAVKLDPKGNLVWARGISDNYYMWNYSVTQDKADRYHLGGYVGRNKDERDLVLITLDEYGNLVWSQQIGGYALDDGGWAAETARDSGMVILGRTRSFFYEPDLSGYYLVKVDSKGSTGAEPIPLPVDLRNLDVEEAKSRYGIKKSFKRKGRWKELNLTYEDMLIDEKLLAGNVIDPVSPRRYILQQARKTDSLTLVKLYKETNNTPEGKSWHRPWEFVLPMDTWRGVELDNDGRVVGLTLIGNGLSGNIPADIKDLNRLKKLRLSYNRLEGFIPQEITELTSLRELHLDNNLLTGGIPDSVSKLEELQILDLAYNKLEANIPGTLDSLHFLQEINLAHNQFSGQMPGVLDSLAKKGVALNLANNRFSGSISETLLATAKNVPLKGNQFDDPYQAILLEDLGGRYEYREENGEYFALFMNELTTRFTLLRGIYDEEGGKSRTIRGTYKLEKNSLILDCELLEKGKFGETRPDEKVESISFDREITVTVNQKAVPMTITVSLPGELEAELSQVTFEKNQDQ